MAALTAQRFSKRPGRTYQRVVSGGGNHRPSMTSGLETYSRRVRANPWPAGVGSQFGCGAAGGGWGPSQRLSEPFGDPCLQVGDIQVGVHKLRGFRADRVVLNHVVAGLLYPDVVVLLPHDDEPAQEVQVGINDLLGAAGQVTSKAT